MLKALKRLCAALWRREKARLAVFRATDADALIEASIVFGVESRIVRRWTSVLGGRLGLFFHLPLTFPTDLVDHQPAPAAATPAPVALRLVR